jgi:hypothetical protein
VIVVSEETARVSVARRGQIELDVGSERLREILEGTVPEAPRIQGGRQSRSLA